MDNLKKMEPQKLAIVTAGIVVVLGLIGVITGNTAIGIVALLLQAGVVFYIIASGSEQAQERTQSDKYRKLFKNLPIGFAQAEIITDGAGDAVGYKVVDANNTFGINPNIIHTIVAIINKKMATNEFAINEIIGITSTGNTTFFTK